MFLQTTIKKGFSSKEIQPQLGLKRYEPVWSMVYKLRKAIGNRDDRYTLEGMIEIDQGYFTIEASEDTHKAGSGAKQNLMLCSSISTVLENIETGKIERKRPYFKAKVLEGHYTEGGIF
jgi:hypothetical protein